MVIYWRWIWVISFWGCERRHLCWCSEDVLVALCLISRLSWFYFLSIRRKCLPLISNTHLLNVVAQIKPPNLWRCTLKKILNHQDNYKWRREVATAEYLAFARRKKTRNDAVPNIWGCFLKMSTEVSMLILLFFILIWIF